MALPKSTRHIGLFMEDDLFEALEEERYVGRHPSRSATIVALLREALDARARSRGEADEAWIALERDTPKAGAKPTPKARVGGLTTTG